MKALIVLQVISLVNHMTFLVSQTEVAFFLRRQKWGKDNTYPACLSVHNSHVLWSMWLTRNSCHTFFCHVSLIHKKLWLRIKVYTRLRVERLAASALGYVIVSHHLNVSCLMTGLLCFTGSRAAGMQKFATQRPTLSVLLISRHILSNSVLVCVMVCTSFKLLPVLTTCIASGCLSSHWEWHVTHG